MEKKRRIYPRVDVNITIKQLGNAVNISEGGICVIAENPLPIGSNVDLDLFLSDLPCEAEQRSSDSVKFEGTVLWTKYSELFDKYEVGIKFINPHPSNRKKIKSFVESYR
ncbi:MAG: PilZ domain protein [Candidatus Scalindua rubra]|uniref:PilZ domain protein n=1 Tax=Candidatus Scalindua rubra TaxID=1872076 RepID=A0A1E3XC66_9BACT|nr:MAG: PilZ domain protein [Candidatus Scalindua rubra]